MTNYKDTEEFLHDLVVDETFISDLIYLEVQEDVDIEDVCECGRSRKKPKKDSGNNQYFFSVFCGWSKRG